jgi:histidinol-phosphate phosphatase family protein
MKNALRRGVLLERDGVILRPTPNGWANSWNELEFLPRALEGLRLLTEHDIPVVVISHQPCIAQHQVSPHELHALTQRMLLEVALAGGKIEKVYYCTHSLQETCLCRKPFPGLLLRAMSELSLRPSDTWMIGDTEVDLEAACRAGCQGILLRRDAFLTAETREANTNQIASSLYEAAERIARIDTPAFGGASGKQTIAAFSSHHLSHSNFSVREKESA